MNDLVNLTELIIKGLVNDSESVSVKEFESDEDNTVLIEVMVSSEDMPKVIGYSGKTCLIIGNEGHGLKQIVSDSCDEIVSIPMRGKVNSLNASVASGILIYEIVKYK